MSMWIEISACCFLGLSALFISAALIHDREKERDLCMHGHKEPECCALCRLEKFNEDQGER